MLKDYTKYLLLLAASQANASAFLINEITSPITATAGVGQAVLADDGSVSYFNPAAMTDLKHNDLLVGGQLGLTNMQFAENSSNTISGGNGRNAGSILPGIGLFGVYHKNSSISYGINVTTPLVGIANYSNGWTGRHFVEKISLLGLAINPSVAYKVNEQLSIGGGLALNYAEYNQTLAVAEGEIEAERLTSFAPQANIGAYYKLNDKTKVGIAYRSSMRFRISGTTRFLRLEATPGISSIIDVPQTVTTSLSHKISKKTTLLADLGWQNWHIVKNTVLTITGLPSINVPRNWKDTWRLGGGAHFQYSDTVKLKSGISYESSPTDVSTRLPGLPFDRQWRFAVGGDIALKNQTKFSTSFEYGNFGRAPINQSNPITGTLSGDYSRNNLYVLQMSLSML